MGVRKRTRPSNCVTDRERERETLTDERKAPHARALAGAVVSERERDGNTRGPGYHSLFHRSFCFTARAAHVTEDERAHEHELSPHTYTPVHSSVKKAPKP